MGIDHLTHDLASLGSTSVLVLLSYFNLGYIKIKDKFFSSFVA